jgi:hypothetical protein
VKRYHGHHHYPSRVALMMAMVDRHRNLEFRRGQVTNGSWSWTAIGKYVYACTTPGGLTQVLSSGSGEQVQIVGMALSATQIDFDPQLVLVEVQ